MAITILDAGVIIGFLDSNDVHHQAAHRALRKQLEQGHSLVMPTSVYAEILVGPMRTGEQFAQTVRDLADRLPFAICAIDFPIAERAAALRARHSALKLPDAFVIATAQHLDAEVILTTDRKWPTRAQLKLTSAIIKV